MLAPMGLPQHGPPQLLPVSSWEVQKMLVPLGLQPHGPPQVLPGISWKVQSMPAPIGLQQHEPGTGATPRLGTIALPPQYLLSHLSQGDAEARESIAIGINGKLSVTGPIQEEL